VAIAAHPARAAEAAPAAAPSAGDDQGIAEGSTIVVTATKANELAPVTASLDATQPQAIVSRSFIQDSLPTAADFNQIALIAPSVSNFGANNGVGLSESKAQIRGFQDGEYNITYDGIPFGDQNDPTHHSNTFFPSNTIETLVVDRGPGNASQLGQATFGGNINLFSGEARDAESVELLGSYGSFNTYVGQAILQSGAIDALGGTRFVVSAQYINSDGALSYEKYKQLNFYAKAVIPLGSDATLSLIATANRNIFNQPDTDGASLAQVAQFGKHYSLSNDPRTQNYFGYNTTRKTTDFYIARFDATIAPGSTVTNSAYTYKYDNETLSGLDVTGNTPNLVTLADGKTKVFGVPGYTKSNKYRVYGDILKVRADFGFGALTVGAQIERSDTFRQQTDVTLFPLSLDYREKAVTAPPTGLTPGVKTPQYVRFVQDSSVNHTEEFAELELRPFDGLKITPGIKHVDYNRRIDALFNQTTRYAQRLSKTYTATLPFLTVNYQATGNVAVYGQYARGFLAPPLSQLYVARPDLSTVDPQRSTNYQAGAVYHGSHLSLDADVYVINFTNKFASFVSPVPGEGTIFTNIGGALYKGVEGQATYAFSNGLAIFANASRNYAKTKGAVHTQVAHAPFFTAAAGVIYRDGPIRFSLIDKYTGQQFAAAGEPAAYRIRPYNDAIVSASYDFGIVRAGIKVSDLFDSTRIVNISPGATVPADQYFFQPGRQITGEVTVKF
ncbi:MAG: TonB-dependent receptor, partial [Sphingomonadaceae bacterium]|nr:TonB-dependent receptor [Sphingomonadaceae bacterium]